MNDIQCCCVQHTCVKWLEVNALAMVPSRQYRSQQRYSTVNWIEAFYNDSTDGDTTAIN